MRLKWQMGITIYALSLVIFLSTTIYIYAQNPSKPPSGKPEVTQSNTNQSQSTQDVDPKERLLKKINEFVGKHPILSIIGTVIITSLVWIFRNFFRNLIIEILNPFFKNLFFRILIRFGRYNSLIKSYRETLKNNLRKSDLTLEMIGEGVDLEKNYIPIQISKKEYEPAWNKPPSSSKGEVHQESKTHLDSEERIDVKETLTNKDECKNRIVIVGDPGSGKTTLLNHLAYECAKENYECGSVVKPIPALITLTAYIKSGKKDILSYLEMLFEENTFPKAKEYIERQLKLGYMLILFDGFDEVEINMRKDISEQIVKFANNNNHSLNRFVVTSRPIKEAVFNGFKHLEVMPLLPEQRKTFLESKINEDPKSDFNAQKCAKLVDTIENNDRIKRLASNPLLLTFLYHVYKYNLEIPRQRVELYRLSVKLMLEWDIETKRPNNVKVKDRDAKKEVLKKVAYYYHISKTRELADDILLEQIESYMPNSLKEKFTAKDLLHDLENSSGLIRHRTSESCQFIHLTFQEYLTADYINDNRSEKMSELVEKLTDTWWREVALLLAGIMGNATLLVSDILNKSLQYANEDSEKLAYIFMAFSCLYEAEVNDNVRAQVLEKMIELPHDQAFAEIEKIYGSFDVASNDIETLIFNILKSPNELLQVWGLGLLERYPKIIQNSEDIKQQIKEIAKKAISILPNELKVDIIEKLALDSITETLWTTLTTEHQ